MGTEALCSRVVRQPVRECMCIETEPRAQAFFDIITHRVFISAESLNHTECLHCELSRSGCIRCWHLATVFRRKIVVCLSCDLQHPDIRCNIYSNIITEFSFSDRMLPYRPTIGRRKIIFLTDTGMVRLYRHSQSKTQNRREISTITTKIADRIAG